MLALVILIPSAGFVIVKVAGGSEDAASAGLLSMNAVEDGDVLSKDDAFTKREPLGSLALKVALETNGKIPEPVEAQPLPDFLQSGLAWLAQSQSPAGGWGAGSHSRQDIRDPRAVKLDPATTAFTTMAFIRSGNTLKTGKYSENVRKAVEYLLGVVEGSPENHPNVTEIIGTQPQAKLGQYIDATMCAQLFTRILVYEFDDTVLEQRVKDALAKCLRKIESQQQTDGSFKGGSWAGVLQSTMANNALEAADNFSFDVDKKVLDKSREYQSKNVDGNTGSVKTDAAAGVSLYTYSSTSRATAKETREAELLIEDAKERGDLDGDAEVTVENLEKAGVKKDKAERYVAAKKSNEQARRQLQNDKVIAGYGNNGGEEFLSHMMTSESMVITGGDDWDKWNTKMHNLMSKVQNPNGSWSGHHCITSPVFCTSAVVMCLTVDRDKEYLLATNE